MSTTLPSGRVVFQEISQQQSFKAWHYWPRVLGQVEVLIEQLDVAAAATDASTTSTSSTTTTATAPTQRQITEDSVMAALSVTAMLIRKGPMLSLHPYLPGTTGHITHAYGPDAYDLLLERLQIPHHLALSIAQLIRDHCSTQLHTAVKLLSCLTNLIAQLQQSWELQHIPPPPDDSSSGSSDGGDNGGAAASNKKPEQQQQQQQQPNVDGHKVLVAKQLIAAELVPQLVTAITTATHMLPQLPPSGQCVGGCALCVMVDEVRQKQQQQQQGSEGGEPSSVSLAGDQAASGSSDADSSSNTPAPAAPASGDASTAATAAAGKVKHNKRSRADDIWTGKAAAAGTVQLMAAELMSVCNTLFQWWPGGAFSSAAVSECCMPAAQLALQALRCVAAQHSQSIEQQQQAAAAAAATAGGDAAAAACDVDGSSSSSSTPPSDVYLELGVCALQLLFTLTTQAANKLAVMEVDKMPAGAKLLLEDPSDTMATVLVTSIAAELYGMYMQGRVQIDVQQEEEEEEGAGGDDAGADCADSSSSSSSSGGGRDAACKDQASKKQASHSSKGKASSSRSSSKPKPSAANDLVAAAEAPITDSNGSSISAGGGGLDEATFMASLQQVHLVSGRDHPMSVAVWQLLSRLEQQQQQQQQAPPGVSSGQLLPALQQQLLEALCGDAKVFVWLACMWWHHRHPLETPADDGGGFNVGQLQHQQPPWEKRSALHAGWDVHECLRLSTQWVATWMHPLQVQQQLMLLQPLLMRWHLWALQTRCCCHQTDTDDAAPQQHLLHHHLKTQVPMSWASATLSAWVNEGRWASLSPNIQLPELGLQRSVVLDMLQACVQLVRTAAQQLLASEQQDGSLGLGNNRVTSCSTSSTSGSSSGSSSCAGGALDLIEVCSLLSHVKALTWRYLGLAERDACLLIQSISPVLQLTAQVEALVRFQGRQHAVLRREQAGASAAAIAELVCPTPGYNVLSPKQGWQQDRVATKKLCGLLTLVAASAASPSRPQQQQQPLHGLLTSLMKLATVMLTNHDKRGKEALTVEELHICCGLVACVGCTARTVLSNWRDPEPGAGAPAAAAGGSVSVPQQHEHEQPSVQRSSSKVASSCSGCRAPLDDGGCAAWLALLGRVFVFWVGMFHLAVHSTPGAAAAGRGAAPDAAGSAAKQPPKFERALCSCDGLRVVAQLFTSTVQPGLHLVQAVMQGVTQQQQQSRQQQQQQEQQQQQQQAGVDGPDGHNTLSQSSQEQQPWQRQVLSPAQLGLGEFFAVQKSRSSSAQVDLQALGVKLSACCSTVGLQDCLQQAEASLTQLHQHHPDKPDEQQPLYQGSFLVQNLDMLDVIPPPHMIPAPLAEQCVRAACQGKSESLSQEELHDVNRSRMAWVLQSVWQQDPRALPTLQGISALAYALSQLPFHQGCNNPNCITMSGSREQALVSGRSSVCGGGCRAAHYCSKRCQQQHWQQHRPMCKAMAAAAAAAAAAAGEAAGEAAAP